MDHTCHRCQGPMVEHRSLLVHSETDDGKCPALRPGGVVHYRSYGDLRQIGWCQETGTTSTKTDEVNCARCTELILADEALLASLE